MRNNTVTILYYTQFGIAQLFHFAYYTGGRIAYIYYFVISSSTLFYIDVLENKNEFDEFFLNNN